MIKVYFNLRRKCFSLLRKGRVMAHRKALALQNVSFLVSEAGRLRVLRDKRKNVHAFVCGELVPIRSIPLRIRKRPVRVGYNPYQRGHFYVDGDVDRTIRSSGYAYLEAAKGKTNVYV